MMVFPGLDVDSRPTLFSRCLAPRAVFRRLSWCFPQNGEVCTVDASVFPGVVRMETWTPLLRALAPGSHASDSSLAAVLPCS